MMKRSLLLAAALGLLAGHARAAPPPDWRELTQGTVIPDEGYADQPYVVHTRDRHWLAVITTGPGEEGAGGQHVVALRSGNRGRSWSRPIDIEPGGGPESSWVVPLATPSGRIYAIYTYNRDNVRRVPDAGEFSGRVDTLGSFAFRYSDDDGRTWSTRHLIPQRTIASDRENNFRGRQLFFWSVAKPVISAGVAYIGFAKVSRWGEPLVLARSRSFVLTSPNIATERDAARIRWEVRPDGDEGIVAPKGAIAEEFNVTALSNGTLMGVYRTIDGFPCIVYSANGGRDWTAPDYLRHAPGGRPLKNPRAFAFARRFANGRYLLWFHNHGGEAVHLRPNWDVYRERNPGWVVAGVERDGRVHWSEPEVLLYDDDPQMRMSYPDFVEDGADVFITETNKSIARTHPIPRAFLNTIWGQFDRSVAPTDGVRLADRMPSIPLLGQRGGFSLDFDLTLKELAPDQTLLDTRDGRGRGILLTTGPRFNLMLTLSDGTTSTSWESDPGLHPGTLAVNRRQHVSVIVDGGPKLISFVVDGVLNDGGPIRQFGWGRFDPSISDVNGAGRLPPAKAYGRVERLTFYPRALMTAEAVALDRSRQP